MQRKKYVGSFCVLLFVIIDVANVNALSFVSCDNPLENEVCNLTCTTTNHSLNVAFNKVPDPSVIAQCDPDFECSGTNQFSISQPDSVTTVLSFKHSRDNSGTWRCAYGITPILVSVPWATYPLTVSTTLTSNTTVDTNIDGNVTLGCLYSEEAPTVTLQYEDAKGNNDAVSAEKFHCNATDIPCTDADFTTYECPVVVKEETGIDNSDTYSIKLKINVSHVQTEDVRTIVTGITFKSSRGTNTPTKKDATAHGIQAGCLAIAYTILMAMFALRDFIRSTGKICGKCFLTFCQFIEDTFFDCCGNRNSKKNKLKLPIEGCLPRTTTSSVVVKGDPDFIKDNVLTLMPKEECLPRTTTPSVVVKGDPDFIKDKVLTLNWLLGFTYLVLYGVIVEVIVLIGVYYGHSKFQEGLVIGVGFVSVLVVSGLCLLVVWMLKKFFKNDASETSRSQSCISLRNGTVTPDERQQPDGDEGIQSTPTEIHTRLSTTPRPLPPRPDIASKPQGTLDSLNSHIVLAPIENPNIPPSIDTLDEQKTDKKPKDKKKKKKKKKDVEQDNPGTGQ